MAISPWVLFLSLPLSLLFVLHDGAKAQRPAQQKAAKRARALGG
jgi:hypothetical protein